MKKMLFVLFIGALTFGYYPQQKESNLKTEDSPKVELRFAPPDYVYVYKDAYNAFAQRPYYDCVLHTISVVNSSTQSVQIDDLKIEALKDGRLIQCRVLSRDEIQRVSKPILAELGGELQTLLDLILWTDKVVPQGFQISSELKVQPKSALPVFNTFFSFSTLPDELRVSVIGKNDNGQSIKTEGSLKVLQYQNKVEHSLPLEGSWLMRGMPANGVLDHHRFGIPNEFGVDFSRFGPNGETFRNDGTKASDFYGFGEKVLASADGTVVAINNSAVQEWTRFNPAKGESQEEFQARYFRELKEGFQGYASGWVGGNYVIIKHAEKEYSSYFHLKEKSVRVQVGDEVKRGQHIGNVGNTGDSFEVHLHFQLNDNADFANGRSLPFSFENIETEFREPGRYVKPKK